MIKLIRDFSRILKSETEDEIKSKIKVMQTCLKGTDKRYKDDLDWNDPRRWIEDKSYKKCVDIANEIRERADVLVLIGVGGSNQGARAAIRALQKENDKIEIVYAGNNLSGMYLNKLLRKLDDKSVYVNIIAKNFSTMEPGIHFRLIRQLMEQRHNQEECARRIIVTGSLNGSSLEKLADDKGYRTLPFPLYVGGRFSALTPVGLLPMMAAGLNCKRMIEGAQDLKDSMDSIPLNECAAVQYAVTRHLLERSGYSIEILSNFDQRLEFFMKWWIQLFSESEGKEGKGLFPAGCNFTEDLHSMGQYIQQGKRNLIETFIKVENTGEDITIAEENTCKDYFDYLNNKKFSDLNNAAYQGTLEAHINGGVPCMEIIVPRLDEYYFGQLFYFFMISCYISCELNGLNPFDQPGVESYKEKMFKKLGKENI